MHSGIAFWKCDWFAWFISADLHFVSGVNTCCLINSVCCPSWTVQLLRQQQRCCHRHTFLTADGWREWTDCSTVGSRFQCRWWTSSTATTSAASATVDQRTVAARTEHRAHPVLVLLISVMYVRSFPAPGRGSLHEVQRPMVRPPVSSSPRLLHLVHRFVCNGSTGSVADRRGAVGDGRSPKGNDVKAGALPKISRRDLRSLLWRLSRNNLCN